MACHSCAKRREAIFKFARNAKEEFLRLMNLRKQEAEEQKRRQLKERKK